MDTVDKLCKFSDKRKNIKNWKNLFSEVLSNWGFTEPSISKLFEWGAEYGHNWEKLHPSQEEELQSSTEILEDFWNEVSYCSDRMSIDRLFRCHWLYNYYFIKLSKEKVKK
jgi:hypothetical protein